MSVSPEDVLRSWFGTPAKGQHFDPKRKKIWWTSTDALDAEITEKFGQTVEEALSGKLDHWLEEPRSSLALVILTDQFTRNIGRGAPEAFRGDVKALSVSLAAQEKGHDRSLTPIERGFLYMPMMHAEDPQMAKRSVQMFAALSKETSDLGLPDYPDFAPHAQQHADIVLRFGRYPHRNAILGRPSTPEEKEFLEDGGPTFGQNKK